MKLRTYTSEAIILARRNYSEADRIISFYSKDYGRLALIAKGVRKPQSRKRGSLEVFNHIKFSAARGRAIDLILEAEIIDSFKSIRVDLKKVSVAYYLAEVVGRITREDEKNDKFFYLLLNTLKDLKDTQSLRKLRVEFVYEALVLLGFWPKGKLLVDPDKVLEQTLERKLSSLRVGKRVLAS